MYRQIADQLGAQVRSGELEGGERLPPIRALARELGVNRDTVALAYEALSVEGLVESTVGRGTFVCALSEVGQEPAPVAVKLGARAERLLAFEAGKPRYGSDADVVALHSLIPDPSLYPIDEFRRALNRVITEGGATLFLYGAPQGHPQLRALIAERFRASGAAFEEDEIVLCHGASQGIALALRLFAEPGDVLAVEVPTYHNVLTTLVALGVEAAPIPTTAAGPDLESLGRALARPEVKGFYTIPTFHNPLGTTTGTVHRRALLEIAARYAKPVIEDAFEMDLRYSGREVPSLAALDPHGLVVHLSSFSKSLFPGVRCGAIAARGRLVDALLALKHATDHSDSMPLQAALAEFVRTGAYDRHLNRMRRVLRGRRDALLEALAATMPPGTTWTRPDGGFQVWVELPFEVDTRDLLADAVRAGVSFAPGSQFLTDRRPSRALRLCIARASEEEIRRGVEALARVVFERREADPALRAAASVNM